MVVQVRMASGGGGSSGSGGGNRAVVWFRGTDLRVHDNVVVHEAARRVQAGTVSEVGARECGPMWRGGMQQLVHACCYAAHVRMCMPGMCRQSPACLTDLLLLTATGAGAAAVLLRPSLLLRERM